MDLLRHFVFERCVDQALTVKSALAFESGRDDLDAEMRLAARPGSRMTRVAMGFVRNLKPVGVERRRQSLSNSVCHLHGSILIGGAPRLRAGRQAVKAGRG